MHQHQLLSFATKFGFFHIPRTFPASQPPTFTDTTQVRYKDLLFLSPVKKKDRNLTPGQRRHLQEHYKTHYEIPNFQDPDLANIDDKVQVWHRCQKDTTMFHCAEYRRSNSTRMSHLACIEQLVDLNATRSLRARPEVMVERLFYVYIQFFCVHTFREQKHMLMYSQYRKVVVHHGLVEDLGPQTFGFQDTSVLEHLCAKVRAHGGKTYLVDDQAVMENRLLDDIISRTPNRR